MLMYYRISNGPMYLFEGWHFLLLFLSLSLYKLLNRSILHLVNTQGHLDLLDVLGISLA